MRGLITIAWLAACITLLLFALQDERGSRKVRYTFGAVFLAVAFAAIGVLSVTGQRPVPVTCCISALLAVWTTWRLRVAREAAQPR
jgi:hypothetical protein